VSQCVDQLQIEIMDLSNEYKLRYIGNWRQNIVLLGTLYIDNKKKFKQKCVDSACGEVK
jgi:hypothetical protein